MDEPKVQSLSYEFQSLETTHKYHPAVPWEGELGVFSCRLSEGRLDAHPQVYFATEEQARRDLEPYLRAWELRSELEDGVRIQFQFSSSQVIGQRNVVKVGVASELNLAGKVTPLLTHHEYPKPASEPLAQSPLVNQLLEFVRSARTRQLPLLVPAYLLLTAIEFEYGGRSQAAGSLNISKTVLNKLGELAARNDPNERRKVKGPVAPLSEPERQWLLAVLPRIAQQAARVAADSRPPLLSMSNLPTL